MGKHLQTIKNAGRRSGSHITAKPRRKTGGALFLLTLRRWPGVRTGNRTCFFVRRYYSTPLRPCQGRGGEKFSAPPGFSPRLPAQGRELRAGQGIQSGIRKGPETERTGDITPGIKSRCKQLCTFSTRFSTARVEKPVGNRRMAEEVQEIGGSWKASKKGRRLHNGKISPGRCPGSRRR